MNRFALLHALSFTLQDARRGQFSNLKTHRMHSASVHRSGQNIEQVFELSSPIPRNRNAFCRRRRCLNRHHSGGSGEGRTRLFMHTAHSESKRYAPFARHRGRTSQGSVAEKVLSACVATGSGTTRRSVAARRQPRHAVERNNQLTRGFMTPAMTFSFTFTRR